MPAAASDQPREKIKSLVSVCMITYNHELYLREAVESVLAQQTEFALELVIGEDCSSDGTREIALEFQTAHPDVVRVLPSIERLGPYKNSDRTLAACRGKYIALLEGDDYWTNPHKLQRQVEVFETNPDIAVVFHQVKVLPESSSEQPRFLPDASKPRRTNIRDILQWHYMHTASIMIRNPHLAHLPEWFEETYMGDWPLVVFCAQRGDIYFIPEPMATYRPTGAGIWSSLSHIEKTKHWMQACLVVDRALSYRYSDILLPRALGFCYTLATLYQKEGLFPEAAAQVRAYWRMAPLLGDWKAKLKLLLGIQYPRVWRALEHLRGRTA